MRNAFILVAASAASVIGANAFGQSLGERLQAVARMQQDTSASRQAASRAQLLGALLYTDITVDFSETPVKEAINYIRSQMGVDLVARFSSDKSASTGINPDATVTLKVDASPALNVIEMVLDQVSDGDPSTWQLRDGFIEIGPKDRLDKSRETRYYPVRDLLFEPPYFDNAPEFDLDSALNQGNNGGGGGGSGGGGSGGGGFGGAGGGGGGGSGGGGGGSGGTIFGSPGEDPERVTEADRAKQLLEIIQESVEPDRWTDTGGDAASIRYYQGVFIVRAPDYIQRQIGGYPFAARPPRPQVGDAAPAAGRYVTFTAPFSAIQNVGFGTAKVTGAAGGGGGNP